MRSKHAVDIKDLAPGIMGAMARTAAKQKWLPFQVVRTLIEDDFHYAYLSPVSPKDPATKSFARRLPWDGPTKLQYVFSGGIAKPLIFATMGFFMELNHLKDMALFFDGKIIMEIGMLVAELRDMPIRRLIPVVLKHPSTATQDAQKHPTELDFDIDPDINEHMVFRIRTEDNQWTVFDPLAAQDGRANVFMSLHDFLLSTAHGFPTESDMADSMLEYIKDPAGRAALDTVNATLHDVLDCLVWNPSRKHGRIVKKMIPDVHGWFE